MSAPRRQPHAPRLGLQRRGGAGGAPPPRAGARHDLGVAGRLITACLLFSAVAIVGSRPAAWQQRGLTAAPTVARAYDTVLNADFDALPAVLAETCGPAPEVACLGLKALGTWWEIQLDPMSTALDSRFIVETAAALDMANAWTSREPERAEAWFYLGAALGVRGQWKVLREQRLSAARDGKRIKEALERALALDPELHDAEFGLGAYRYYAGVAPSYLRWLRWLLLLPGGDREGGLAQMERASRQGQIVASEADYQLHVIYLWYERRFDDALALVLELQRRYPRNPLFRHLEAQIEDVYFGNHARSLAASEALLAAAIQRAVHRPDIAEVRARLNIAVQLDHLGQRDRAIAIVDAVVARAPRAPADALPRARELQRAWARR